MLPLPSCFEFNGDAATGLSHPGCGREIQGFRALANTLTLLAVVISFVGTQAVENTNKFLDQQLSRNHSIECPLQTIPGPDNVGYLLAPIFDHKEGTIMIIGANIGANENDPNWKYFKRSPRLTKLLVEPVPSIFTSLTANVKRDRLKNVVLINAAITNNTNQNLIMYCLENSPQLPWWGSQLCSGSRDRLFSSYDITKVVNRSIIEPLIYQVVVPTMTFSQLREKAHGPIRMVQIDVEGFDDDIVFQLPLNDPSFNPDIILFEHILLSPQRLQRAMDHLHRHGYRTCFSDHNSQNTFVFREDYIRSLNKNSLGFTDSSFHALRNRHNYECSELSAIAQLATRNLSSSHPTPPSDYWMHAPWSMHATGMVVTIGANIGDVFADNNWAAALRSQFDKLYVEPVPELHQQLVANIAKKHMINAQALQLAVVGPHRVPNGNTFVSMYCIPRKPSIRRIPMQQVLSIPKQQLGDHRSRFPWCSVSKERFYSMADFGANLANEDIDSMLETISVPAVTVKNLITSQKIRFPIRMVIVAAEGLEHEIIMNLPLTAVRQKQRKGVVPFNPDIIAFNNAYLGTRAYAETLQFLHDNGYSTCQQSSTNARTFAYKPTNFRAG